MTKDDSVIDANPKKTSAVSTSSKYIVMIGVIIWLASVLLSYHFGFTRGSAVRDEAGQKLPDSSLHEEIAAAANSGSSSRYTIPEKKVSIVCKDKQIFCGDRAIDLTELDFLLSKNKVHQIKFETTAQSGHTEVINNLQNQYKNFTIVR